MSSEIGTTKQPLDLRLDGPELDMRSLWSALSMTPGVGVSITDREGRLIFVNETTHKLFSGERGPNYVGKTIADYHPPEFVAERLELIRQVLDGGRPSAITHVYNGRRISSTIWPIQDSRPPFGRVIVISREMNPHEATLPLEVAVPQFETKYIDLGELNTLSTRELEVLVMLGHGLTVPEVAASLHRSPKTIERHKASIAHKLGTHRQAELVSLVTTLGLDLDDLKLKRLPQERPAT